MGRWWSGRTALAEGRGGEEKRDESCAGNTEGWGEMSPGRRLCCVWLVAWRLGAAWSGGGVVGEEVTGRCSRGFGDRKEGELRFAGVRGRAGHGEGRESRLRAREQTARDVDGSAAVDWYAQCGTVLRLYGLTSPTQKIVAGPESGGWLEIAGRGTGGVTGGLGWVAGAAQRRVCELWGSCAVGIAGRGVCGWRVSKKGGKRRDKS